MRLNGFNWKRKKGLVGRENKIGKKLMWSMFWFRHGHLDIDYLKMAVVHTSPWRFVGMLQRKFNFQVWCASSTSPWGVVGGGMLQRKFNCQVLWLKRACITVRCCWCRPSICRLVSLYYVINSLIFTSVCKQEYTSFQVINTRHCVVKRWIQPEKKWEIR